MNEFIIGLVGELNVSGTIKNIKSDLKTLSENLNQSGNERITLVGRLDPAKTTETLQKQLDLISNNLKLEIKSDGLNNVVQSLKELGSTLSQITPSSAIQKTLAQQTEAFEVGTKAGEDYLRVITKTFGGNPESQTRVKQTAPFRTEATTYGYNQESKKYTVERTKLVTQNYEAEAKAAQKAELAAKKYEEELVRTFKLITEADSNKFIENTKAQGEAFTQIESVLSKVKNLGTITNAAQFNTEKAAIDADIKSLNDYISMARKAEAQAKQSENAAARLSQSLQKSVSQYTDPNAARPILNTDELDKLSVQAGKASAAIDNLRNANSQNYAELERTAKQAVAQYEQMAKAAQNAESMATKLQAKPIDIVKNETLDKLIQFDADLRRAGLTFDETITRFDGSEQSIRAALEGLKTQFEDIGNSKQKLIEFGYAFSEVETRINAFRREKGFFDNLKAEVAQTDENIKKLRDSMQNSKFSGDARIATFLEQLQHIDTEYQQLQTDLSDADPKSLENMEAQIRNKSESIKQKIAEIKNGFAALTREMKASSNADILSNDKQVLSNRITIWLNENTKAAESTRQALRNLQAQIQSANAEQLRNLKKEFDNIRTSAQAAGQTGKKFLDVFKQNVFKFTSWFGIGSGVAMIARSIRSATQELREMDTVLTEIRKTSGRTEEDLRALGSAAFDTASKFGKTVNDYLSGVLEMSRAGYSNAEAMAEVSLKAQSAGAMTADLANQYLIATDAAYKLNGSEEKLTEILDGQNMINKIVPLYGNIQR